MALDEKGRMLEGRLEFFERNIHKLTKHMTTLVSQHKDGVEARLKFSDRVKDVAAQEPFADLQDRLIALSETSERVALERQAIMVSRAQTQVLQKLEEVQKGVIQPTKILLKDREQGVKRLIKAEHAFEVAKEKGKIPGGQMPVPLIEQRHQVKNTERVVDNNMELFEVQRIEDVKDILEEFIRCELYYHCRALEVLAPALTHLTNVDGALASENMRDDLEALNQKLYAV